MKKVYFTVMAQITLPVGTESSGGGWNLSVRTIYTQIPAGTRLCVESNLEVDSKQQVTPEKLVFSFGEKTFDMQSQFEVLGRLIACGVLVQCTGV